MAWRGGRTGTRGQATANDWRLHLLLGNAKKTITRAGLLKLFILGFAIGVGIGILGGRAAERFRLSDYVAIEQTILQRERPPDSHHTGPPRFQSPGEPSRM